jgi:hypothetical protein
MDPPLACRDKGSRGATPAIFPVFRNVANEVISVFLFSNRHYRGSRYYYSFSPGSLLVLRYDVDGRGFKMQSFDLFYNTVR